MASTAVEICNQALAALGVTQYITALTDLTKEAQVANLYYEDTRKRLLASFPWPFALHTRLLPEFPTTVSAVTHAGTGTGVITATATGTTGTLDVKIAVSMVLPVGVMLSVSLDGGLTYGTATALPSFPAATSLGDLGATLPDGCTVSINGTADGTGVYVAGDTYSFTVSDGKNPQWPYAYQLPTDCLRTYSIVTGIRGIRSDQRIPFALGYASGAKVLWTDLPPVVGATMQASSPVLSYIADVSDPTLWPSSFSDALSLLLAVKMAMPLAINAQLKQAVYQDSLLAISEARAVAMLEGQEDQAPDSETIAARGSYWPTGGSPPGTGFPPY